MKNILFTIEDFIKNMPPWAHFILGLTIWVNALAIFAYFGSGHYLLGITSLLSWVCVIRDVNEYLKS